MKPLLIIAVSLLLITSACTKSTSSSSSSSSSGSNTITISDGSSYTATGVPETQWNSSHPQSVSFIINKDAGYSTIDIQMTNTSGTNYPFTLTIFEGNKGPANGMGVFTSTSTIASFKENFTGGQSYTIDSFNINITALSTNNIAGYFTLHMGSKTVTGIISGNSPTIK